MKNKIKILLAAIGILILGGVIVVSTKNVSAPPGTKNTVVYCSPNGTLTDTMPIQSYRSYCIKSDSRHASINH